MLANTSLPLALALKKPASAATHYTLTAGPGSFVLTASTATPKVARKLVAGPGSFSLTGSAATLTYTPGTGAIHYTFTADPGAIYLNSPGAKLTVGNRNNADTHDGSGQRRVFEKVKRARQAVEPEEEPYDEEKDRLLFRQVFPLKEPKRDTSRLTNALRGRMMDKQDMEDIKSLLGKMK